MGTVTLPNQRLWTSVFKEIFKDLDKKELAPHAQLLFGQEYKIHQIHATSWLKCRKCKKKWHSYKGSVEFMYGLKKEGKPKKRVGKVILLPYGQQCKVCVEKALVELHQEKLKNGMSNDENEEGEDRHGEDEIMFTNEPFWLPYFDEQTIRETLHKVYEIVEEKFYDKTGTSFENKSYYKTRPSSSRSSQLPPRRSSSRPDFRSTMGYASNLPNIIYYHDGVNQPNEYLGAFDHQNLVQQVNQPGNAMYPFMTSVFPQHQKEEVKLTDDDGESVVGSNIGNGPHKSDLCEACKKGKCNYQKNENGESGMESGRQSRRGSERIAKPPSFDDGLPEDVNSTNKVRWFLKFEEL